MDKHLQSSFMLKRRIQISIVGLGNVGKFIAGTLLSIEDVRLDINIMDPKPAVIGAVYDLEHAAAIKGNHKFTFNSNDRFQNADFIFHCAGTPVPKGASRLVTCQSSIEITETVFEDFQSNKEPFIIVLANPVEIITLVTQRLTGLPKYKVVGTGTFLDSVRMDHEIRKKTNDDDHIRAVLLGEHGAAAYLSEQLSFVNNRSLSSRFTQKELDEMLGVVKASAGMIKHTQEATIYGVGHCAIHLFKQLLKEEKQIIPVSTFFPDEGFEDFVGKDICLSLPASVSSAGVFCEKAYSPDGKEWLLLEKAARHLIDCIPDKYL